MGIDRIGGGVAPLPDSVGPLEEVSTSAVAPAESRPARQIPTRQEQEAVKPMTGEGETAAPYDGVMTQGEVMKVKLDDRVGFDPIPIPQPASGVSCDPIPIPEPAGRVGFEPIPLPEPADLPTPVFRTADLPGPMPEPAEMTGSLQEPTGRQVIQEVASQPDPVPQGVRDVIAQQLADRVGYDPVPIPEPKDEQSGLVAGLTAPTAERPDLAQLDRPVEDVGKSEMYMEKGPTLQSELFKPREG